MISRRGFFGALATAAVGACIATKIPTALLPQPVRYRAACEYLLKHYRAYTQSAHYTLTEEWPRAILVGRELFDAYESEIVAMEFVAYAGTDPGFQSLCFKGAAVVEHPCTGLRGWDIIVLNREQWAKAKVRIENGKSLEWVQNAA